MSTPAIAGHEARVRDHMVSNPNTVSSESRLLEAFLTMRTHNIRHLPVVSSGKLVGLLTERDVYRYAPSVLVTSPDKYNKAFEQIPVGTVMTKTVTTVAPDCLMVDAIALLYENKFGCLPVVEDDRLVGILLSTDVLGFAHNILSSRPTEEPR